MVKLGIREEMGSVCAMRESVRVTFYSCIKDEGGPLETGLQELVSNHLMLHLLRAFVVSDKEKVSLKGSGDCVGDD